MRLENPHLFVALFPPPQAPYTMTSDTVLPVEDMRVLRLSLFEQFPVVE